MSSKDYAIPIPIPILETIDYSSDAAFDQSVDVILDTMYRSADRNMQTKARQFEEELQETHAQTYWMTRIVNAWAKSNDRRAVSNAEQVISIMSHLYNAGYDCCKPNTVTYNSLLNCLAHCQDPNAALRAEQLLQQMWNLVETKQNLFVRPSTISYSSVLQAWSKSTDYQNKGIRAEQLLRDQWKRFQQQGGSQSNKNNCRPDSRTYNHVIAVWGYSKQPDAYQRADALVQEMWELYHQDQKQKQQSDNDDHNDDESYRIQDKQNAFIKPNKVTMTMLLNSLQHSSRFDPQIADQADQIVKDMWSMVDEDHMDLKPNAIVYTTLLQIWTASRHPSAPTRVWELLQEMKRRYYDCGEADFRPTLEAYKHVMGKLVHDNNTAGSRTDAADRAERLLQELWTRTNHGETRVHPNTDVYVLAIQACARRRRSSKNGKQQQQLQQMEEEDDDKGQCEVESSERLLYDLIARYRAGDSQCMPNSAAFVAVFQAYANRHNSEHSFDPNRIVVLLQEMYKLQDEGAKRVAPDRKTMTTVVELLTRNHQRNCLEKAEEILDLMWSKAVGSGRPDCVTYLTIMSAWTRSREPDAVDRAEALYQDLWKRYESTGNKKIKPDTVVCNAMITAYAKGRREDAVDKAQAIFNDMVRRHVDGDTNIAPDTVSHNSILNALAKSKRAGSAERAEEMLREMWKAADDSTVDGADQTEGRPNTVTISTVIDAWSHAKTPGAPYRAQALLDEALERFKKGDDNIKPNAFTYTPVIFAWCASQDPQGPFKAESILKRMYKEGYYPNKIVYSHVIAGFGRLMTREGAERADALLRDLWTRFDNGNKSMKPDTNMCNTVLLAWANSGADDAPERAKLILNEMLHRVTTRGDRNVVPSRVTYNTVLSCWSKNVCMTGVSAQEAQDLMDDLWNRAKDTTSRYHGGGMASPDRVNYTNVMYAWAKSSAPDAVDKATIILRQLWQRYEVDLANDDDQSSMKPDAAVYAALMQVYINQQRPDTYEKAKELIQEMKDRGMEFTTRLYGTFIKALGTKPGTNDEIDQVLCDMEQQSMNGGRKGYKLDTYFINTALSNLARPTEMDGLERAHTLLNKMWTRYKESQDKTCKPDMTSYTLLMNAHRQWGSSKSEIEALIADVYCRYEQGDASFAPTSIFERIQQSLQTQGIDNDYSVQHVSEGVRSNGKKEA